MLIDELRLLIQNKNPVLRYELFRNVDSFMNNPLFYQVLETSWLLHSNSQIDFLDKLTGTRCNVENHFVKIHLSKKFDQNRVVYLKSRMAVPLTLKSVAVLASKTHHSHQVEFHGLYLGPSGFISFQLPIDLCTGHEVIFLIEFKEVLGFTRLLLPDLTDVHLIGFRFTSDLVFQGQNLETIISLRFKSKKEISNFRLVLGATGISSKSIEIDGDQKRDEVEIIHFLKLCVNNIMIPEFFATLSDTTGQEVTTITKYLPQILPGLYSVSVRETQSHYHTIFIANRSPFSFTDLRIISKKTKRVMIENLGIGETCILRVLSYPEAIQVSYNSDKQDSISITFAVSKVI